ncbi:hypothetical protein Tco_0627890 [Tanacetum coccineum]|uniref:Uncharacterized protein n=1 Tax=Tanacetum coccineum TaxID=301880 RepID=A0ABQ4WNX5_9ASTR
MMTVGVSVFTGDVVTVGVLVTVDMRSNICRCFAMFVSMMVMSLDIDAMDSSIDGTLGFGGVESLNESTIVIDRFDMVNLPRSRYEKRWIRPFERARLQEKQERN